MSAQTLNWAAIVSNFRVSSISEIVACLLFKSLSRPSSLVKASHGIVRRTAWYKVSEQQQVIERMCSGLLTVCDTLRISLNHFSAVRQLICTVYHQVLKRMVGANGIEPLFCSFH